MQIAYGYFKQANGEYSWINNTGVAAGFRGWTVLWQESDNGDNAWAHEVGHGYHHQHWVNGQSHQWIDEYPYGGYMSPDAPQFFDIVLRQPRTWYRVNAAGPVPRENSNGTPFQVNGVTVEPIHDPMNSGEFPNAVNFYTPYMPPHHLKTQNWFADGPVYAHDQFGEIQSVKWNHDREVYTAKDGGNDPIMQSVPVYAIFGTMAHESATDASQVYPVLAKRHENVFEMTDPEPRCKEAYVGGQYFVKVSYEEKPDAYALIGQPGYDAVNSPFTAFNFNVLQTDKPNEVSLYFSPTAYPNITLENAQLMHTRTIDREKIDALRVDTSTVLVIVVG